jgi:hypothetical protein
MKDILKKVFKDNGFRVLNVSSKKSFDDVIFRVRVHLMDMINTNVSDEKLIEDLKHGGVNCLLEFDDEADTPNVFKIKVKV